MTMKRLVWWGALCAVLFVGPSTQEAAPKPEAAPSPAPTPDAKASASADASFSYTAPHFGPGFGDPIHDGRSIGAASHIAGSHGDHGHCALLIPGHGKSSHFDHSFGFNDIHHDGVTCITFQSIDIAFSKARDRLGLPRPEKDDNAEQRSELGAVLLETTRLIAEEYHLPKDVIVNGLPLIDTHKTIIGTVCSDFTRPRPCKVEKYRSVSGVCNNLDNPHWGSSLSTFKRYLLPQYHDGLDAPRFYSKHGHKLPSPRVISAHVHRDEGLHDHAITIMAVAWGQAIDHDMTLTAETKLPGTEEDPKCCDRDKNFPECLPISVPNEDPFYSLFKQNCITLTRSRPGLTHKCKLGPRTQINEISSYLDGNWVYGNDIGISRRIRLFKGGLLKTLPVFREFGLKDMLPLKLVNPEAGCIRPNNEVFCFDAGDNRVNEQLVLAVVHTLLMREHNRIVIELSKINPHWDDEKLYQEGRHIVAAIIQHITYNEFLPMVLGKDMMQKHDLILKKHGYFEGYNPKIDGSVTAQFITATFRFGHSLLPSTIERWSPNHKFMSSQRLSHMLRQPYDLYKGGWCDQYIMGLCNQVAQAMDDAVSQEVTNHLFQEPMKKFGMDLAAINMQRAREHGVPSYNDYREFCGMPRIHSWSDLGGWMTNKTVHRYSDVYRHPDDIDLWSGGVSEKPLPGSMVGPTFSCLLGLSFKDLRYGDRFWYENPGYPSSFTPHQLDEIRKIKLSRVICDNTDDIKKIQVYVMVLPDHDINPRVPCDSAVLPRMDLSAWADPHGPHPGSFHGHHQTSGHHLQDLNLPPGTREHFRNPGDESGEDGGSAAGLLNVGPALGSSGSAAGLLNVGPTLGSSGSSADLLNVGPSLDDFSTGGVHDFGSSFGNNFGSEFQGANFASEFEGFGNEFKFDVKPDIVGTDVNFGDSIHLDDLHHDGGIVPHTKTHEGIQYGHPQHGNEHSFSTGYSDFAIGEFGPVKGDTVIHKGHGGGHFGSGFGFKEHSHGHRGSFNGHHSLGSVPYGPTNSYGPPPKHYGPPRSAVSNAVVIPLRSSYNRQPQKGKGGGSYFKKFMGMFGI